MLLASWPHFTEFAYILDMALVSPPLWERVKTEVGEIALVRCLSSADGVGASAAILRRCSLEFSAAAADSIGHAGAWGYALDLIDGRAAALGRLDVISARPGGAPSSRWRHATIALAAAANGQLEVLEWAVRGGRLSQNDNPQLVRCASRRAVAGDFGPLLVLHTEGVLGGVIAYGGIRARWAFEVAMVTDSVELFRWLTERGHKMANDRLMAEYAMTYRCGPRVSRAANESDDGYYCQSVHDCAADPQTWWHARGPNHPKMLAESYRATFGIVVEEICQAMASRCLYRALEWLHRRGELRRLKPETVAARISGASDQLEFDDMNRRAAIRWVYQTYGIDAATVQPLRDRRCRI